MPDAERVLAGDEGGTAGGAGLLPVVVGEERSLPCDAVNIWCLSAHHAAVIGAYVPNSDVIRHDD
jgi:hypothetical protein